MTSAYTPIAWGYQLPEGLRVSGKDLYFSDAIAGGVYRWSEATGVEVVVPKRRGVGGIAVHSAGGLVLTGRNLVHVRDGETTLLFDGQGALGLNDLTVDPAGDVLVGALRMDWRDPSAGSPGEVWRVAKGKAPEAEVAPISYPNGIGISPDGGTLYVCDYVGQQVYSAEIGSTNPPRLFTKIEQGNPDGLAIDVEGSVWVATGPGGSFDRFDRQGELTARLEPPATFAVTLCFGGEDGRDLYLATADNSEEAEKRGTIFRTRSEVAGLPVREVA